MTKTELDILYKYMGGNTELPIEVYIRYADGTLDSLNIKRVKFYSDKVALVVEESNT